MCFQSSALGWGLGADMATVVNELHFLQAIFIAFTAYCFVFLSSETVAKTGMILLAGEITSRANVDYQKVVRDTIKHIGYNDSSKGKIS